MVVAHATSESVCGEAEAEAEAPASNTSSRQTNEPYLTLQIHAAQTAHAHADTGELHTAWARWRQMLAAATGASSRAVPQARSRQDSLTPPPTPTVYGIVCVLPPHSGRHTAAIWLLMLRDGRTDGRTA